MRGRQSDTEVLSQMIQRNISPLRSLHESSLELALRVALPCKSLPDLLFPLLLGALSLDMLPVTSVSDGLRPLRLVSTCRPEPINDCKATPKPLQHPHQHPVHGHSEYL